MMSRIVAVLFSLFVLSGCSLLPSNDNEARVAPVPVEGAKEQAALSTAQQRTHARAIVSVWDIYGRLPHPFTSGADRLNSVLPGPYQQYRFTMIKDTAQWGMGQGQSRYCFTDVKNKFSVVYDLTLTGKDANYAEVVFNFTKNACDASKSYAVFKGNLPASDTGTIPPLYTPSGPEASGLNSCIKTQCFS